VILVCEPDADAALTDQNCTRYGFQFADLEWLVIANRYGEWRAVCDGCGVPEEAFGIGGEGGVNFGHAGGAGAGGEKFAEGVGEDWG